MPDVILNGPSGRIEGRYHHSKISGAPIAIVLHPHPQHGGTMNNKVVYTLYRSFVERGFNVLRFNFRGVGKSEGVYDNGEGELSDAAAALDWLQSHNPNTKGCWISGFSFGSWIGMQLLMRRPEVDGFVMVSPPANLYDFSFLAPCPVSGMMIQGNQDNIVHHEAVEKLSAKLSTQRGIAIDYRLLDGADHFFNQQLDHVSTCVHDYLDFKDIPLLKAANE